MNQKANTVQTNINSSFKSRSAAVAVAAGPIILLTGFIWHPYIVNLTDNVAVVNALGQDTTRWFWSHLSVALGSAVLLLGLLAVRAHVRTWNKREEWTAWAITPLVIASVLFAMLPAMEITVMAAHEAGADTLAVQEAMDRYFIPILLAGSAAFAVGAALFATGVVRAHVLPGPTAALFAAGLGIMAASRFIPMGASLIIGGAAGVIGFAPIALLMWRAGFKQSPQSPPGRKVGPKSR